MGKVLIAPGSPRKQGRQSADIYGTTVDHKHQQYRTPQIRHQCKETTDLSCHRCLINTGVEKININID
jgi:hypothetical protein